MLTENKFTEFKREYVDDIKNTVVAFANTDGGTLYIGVNDDGTVCGVQDVDGTMLRVTNALRDAVRPDITMFVECRNEIMDGKPIIASEALHGPIISMEKGFGLKVSMSAKVPLPSRPQTQPFLA